jgi:hypothetical protein
MDETTYNDIVSKLAESNKKIDDLKRSRRLILGELAGVKDSNSVLVETVEKWRGAFEMMQKKLIDQYNTQKAVEIAAERLQVKCQQLKQENERYREYFRLRVEADSIRPTSS